MDEELCAKILVEIAANQKKTGGHSGLKPVSLVEILKVDYIKIKDCLNHLYDTDQIKVRDGMNSHLLFIPN